MVATLSVSGRGLSKDCLGVVSVMRQLRIAGDVTPNTSLVEGGAGEGEAGCRVVLSSRPSKVHALRLWQRLADDFELTCAHVSLRDDDVVAEGCVHDVLRDSSCPARPR